MGIRALLILVLLLSSAGYARDRTQANNAPLWQSDLLQLENISARVRFAERTILGDDAPEKFKAYDVSANFRMPHVYFDWTHWALGTNFMASAGIIRGAEQNALALSAVPEAMLRSKDGKYTFNAGIGLAAFSRHRFGIQDFGGPFQFALTYGMSIQISEHYRIGYRFQHYSDAGLNGPDTTGADLHMVEIYYQF